MLEVLVYVFMNLFLQDECLLQMNGKFLVLMVFTCFLAGTSTFFAATIGAWTQSTCSCLAQA